ncbi:transforming growth factor-beta-induced protein ig-h3-like [Aplysia californica]|uniref:Transforming growth factor-beta-induced protein ig-h3-like n=1 Tax=Aplysia californica TaxID=6500 RepID=A0ABM1A5V3_APLCA|nr:transforming growth factor-beta-induced protein ig-h3-like [Aplysia californica]
MALLLYFVALGVSGVLTQSTSQMATTTTVPRTPKPAPDLVTVLANKGHYSVILGLLNSTGLLNQLLAAPQMTLFAPTDEALAKLPPQELTALQADPQRLTQVLSYHAVTGLSFEVKGRNNDKVLSSSSGQPIRINVYPIVHAYSAEGVKISEKDIQVANGYVQGIDGIMVPPEGDIIDLLAKRPDMKTLTSLLKTAGLVNTIKADHNITVFAPTDAAFAKLSPPVLTYLQDNPGALAEVLLYHVVARKTLYSIGMRQAMSFPTADSHHDSLMLIEDSNGDIYLNHAKLLEVDHSATNGVLHVIDDVIVPIRIILAIEGAGLSLVG